MTLVHELRHAFRSLVQRPGYTIVAVLTLALGIGANTAVYSVVDAVLLSPLSYPEPDRLVRLFEAEGDRRTLSFSPANFLDLRRDATRYEHLTGYLRFRKTLLGAEPVQIGAASVCASFFETLGVLPAFGRSLAGTEPEERAVVLSHSLWQTRLGGDPGVIGETLVLDDVPHVVRGVMPRGFRGPDDAALWTRAPFDVPEMPLMPDADLREVRDTHYLRVLGRLKPGVSIEAANAEAATIAERLATDFPEANAGRTISVRRLEDALVGSVRPALLVLLGAVTLVLLLTCANVAHLVLARTTSRRRELAVRTALGAGRGRLGSLLLAESLWLSVAGGGLGVLLALWGLEAVIALAPGDLPRLDEVALDGPVLAFAAALSLATGLLFGLAPALHAPRMGVAEALKAGGRHTSGDRRPRRSRALLVIAQFALSLVLLAGAGLLTRSFLALRAVDPGFQPVGVLTVDLSLPRQRYLEESRQAAFFRELLDRLRALPGVDSAAAVLTLPISGSGINSEVALEGEPLSSPAQTHLTGYQVISDGYFETMGIPLLDGRDLGPGDDAQAPPVAVVSRSFAESSWPGENPLGKRLTFDTPPSPDSPWYTVVGVADDVRHEGLDQAPRPDVYFPFSQDTFSFTTLVIRAAGELAPLELVPAVRREVRVLDPDQPLGDVATLEAELARSVGQRRFVMVLVGIFAALALGLAAVGLYGVMAYAVTERRHELGIRLALGATRRRLLRGVLGETVALAVVGVALGLLAALALTRLLASLLYQVKASDPLTFATGSTVLLAVALLAGLVPALRAVRVDPARTLREE